MLDKYQIKVKLINMLKSNPELIDDTNAILFSFWGMKEPKYIDNAETIMREYRNLKNSSEWNQVEIEAWKVGMYK